jgi:hypothetical protein
MLSLEKETIIVGLLVEAVSIRGIVRMTGVARNTVRRIKRSNGPRPRSPLPPSDPRNHQSQPQRCPRCGRPVYMPCKACELESRH